MVWLLGSVLSGGGVTPLPRGPMVERLLFEEPWAVMGLVVLVGLALVFGFYKQGRVRSAAVVGVVSVLVAGGVYGLSRAVTTEREALVRESVVLVRLVSEGDRDGVERMLHPDAVLVANMPAWSEMDRRAILARIHGVLRGMELRTAVLNGRATLDGPNVARSQVRVRVQDAHFADLAWWGLDWRRDAGEGWRVVRIQRLAGVGDRPLE